MLLKLRYVCQGIIAQCVYAAKLGLICTLYAKSTASLTDIVEMKCLACPASKILSAESVNMKVGTVTSRHPLYMHGNIITYKCISLACIDQLSSFPGGYPRDRRVICICVYKVFCWICEGKGKDILHVIRSNITSY